MPYALYAPLLYSHLLQFLQGGAARRGRYTVVWGRGAPGGRGGSEGGGVSESDERGARAVHGKEAARARTVNDILTTARAAKWLHAISAAKAKKHMFLIH